MLKFILIATLTLAAIPGFADETFTFSCIVNSIDSKGKISKLTFDQETAVLNGKYLDSAEVGAHSHQEVANSVNKYVNGKKAKVLIATVVKSDLKADFDGDPNNIASRIYSVEVSVKTESVAATTFFGVCSQIYSGD